MESNITTEETNLSDLLAKSPKKQLQGLILESPSSEENWRGNHFESPKENLNADNKDSFPRPLEKLIEEALRANRSLNTGFTYEITFSIHYQTIFGEKIVVTGSSDWLGNWDPLRGFDLEWNPGNIWSNKMYLTEGSLCDTEYKYVCMKNSYCRWEQRKNRTLALQQALQIGQKLIFNQEEVWDR